MHPTCDKAIVNVSLDINEEWKEDNEVLFNPSNVENSDDRIIRQISSPTTTPPHADKRFEITNESRNIPSLGLNEDSSATHSANSNND